MLQRPTKDLALLDRHHVRDWTAGILVVCGVILVILLGLMMSHTGAPDWISQAAQAEFVGSSDVDIAPTQIARPNEQNWTVTAHKK